MFLENHSGTRHDLDKILFLPIEPKTVFLVFDMAVQQDRCVGGLVGVGGAEWW